MVDLKRLREQISKVELQKKMEEREMERINAELASMRQVMLDRHGTDDVQVLKGIKEKLQRDLESVLGELKAAGIEIE